jgi:hypothetical protein
MPERKGRKRRPRDRRRDREDAGARDPGGANSADEPREVRPAPVAARRATHQAPLPSATARSTGFMIAVVTAFIAAVMIQGAISGNHSAIDATVRIVAGVLLVALSIVVAVLCLAPRLVRDLLARRGG